MVAVNDSRIYLIYKAKNVNIVASGNGNQSTIAVKLDGKNLNQSSLGSDDVLVNGTATATISASRLYNIVSTPSYGAARARDRREPGIQDIHLHVRMIPWRLRR